MVPKKTPADDPKFVSALARELFAIPAGIRQRFGIPDITIDVLEAVVVTVRELLDDRDARPLLERLQDASSRFEPLLNLDPERVQRFTQWVDSDFQDDLKRRIAEFQSPAKQRFLNKILGSAHFTRLKRAAAEDGALLVLAARRMLRFCLPVAQAIHDAATAAPAAVRDGSGLSFTEFTLVHMSLQLDNALDQLMEKQGLRLEDLDLPYRADEGSGLDVDVDELVHALRAALSDETMRRAEEISEQLGRKLRGFEQALELSDDGASQAATSLVEFIDRLLRGAFDETYVLAWSQEHFPSDSTLVYTPSSGNAKPRATKRAQALCFVYAGQAPNEHGTLEPLMAATIVSVRNLAEKIKHADRGTEEEKHELRELMASFRGAMTFTMRFTWTLADDDRLEYLRDRFAKAA